MGPSNQIVTSVGGTGTTPLLIPRSISVPPADDPSGDPETLDCRFDDSCAVWATTIGGDFHYAMPIVLEYLVP